jgi:hypothetical protein
MLKKISWIVALFAALTIVFMGCTNLGVDPDAPVEDVERVDLGAPGFNTVAGQSATQRGWATDGYVDGDNPVVAAEGYKIADFKKAKYLVIETGKNAMGGMQFVWQSKDAPDDGWKTQKFDALANDSKPNKGVTKEANKLGGQTIKIDLKTIMGPTYAGFLDCSDFVRFVIAYYSPNLDDLNVKEAYLLVSAEAQSGGTSLPGLNTKVGLGDTTIRRSGSEYGWTFAVKDSKGNVPKGTKANPIKFKDVKELRDADWLVLITDGGGRGINDGIGGFDELSVTFEATGKYVDRVAETTSLYGENFPLNFNQGGQVVFVIDLQAIPGFDKIVAEQTFSQAEVDKDKELKDKAKGFKVGEIKYYVVNLILKTNFAELALVKAYLIDDPGVDLATPDPLLDESKLPGSADSEALKGQYLGQVVGPFGASYVTDYDVTVPIFFDASVVLFDVTDQSNSVFENNASGGLGSWTGSGWGHIPLTTATTYTALNALPAGSFLRVTMSQTSGADRS